MFRTLIAIYTLTRYFLVEECDRNGCSLLVFSTFSRVNYDTFVRALIAIYILARRFLWKGGGLRECSLLVIYTLVSP